jgi:DNA-directed RNA polymerase I subunit RPA1
LLFAALPESLAVSSLPIIYGEAAVLKPKRLWTGKQLISAVLANVTRGLPPLTLRSKCKVSARLWTPSHAAESTVSIHQGYWLHGVADKSQLGASTNGLVHGCYELYGGRVAGLLLSVLGRLLTRWDQLFGFTCRMDDLLLRGDADDLRVALFAREAKTAHSTTLNYVQTALADESDPAGALERVIRDQDLIRGLDGAMKVAMNGVTSCVIDATLPHGQLLAFPANNMSLMTLTGAKGSMVNFSQISGCLGQQELEGRRVPSMVSGRTLPAFTPFCTDARAGGYIAQRFLTGIRPAEFYFHCMAGREGLIDTAVKTSRSGYLQRCLIKHLEPLRIHYDHTVRTEDHSVVQFCYGEDGLDVVKQAALGPQQLQFCHQNFSALLLQCQPQRALQHVAPVSAVRRAASRAHRKPEKHFPVLASHFPTQLGATSEKFYSSIESFLKEEDDIKAKKSNNSNDNHDNHNNNDNHNNRSIPTIENDQFRALMWLKYMRSLAEPGEAVGLLAAQSLGEPSTQMTLNTFHFAGFGAKNVTLGIPRLREIIMTASPNLKTPTMTLSLTQPWAKDPQAATQLTHKLSKLTMKNVLQNVTVTERLVSSFNAGDSKRLRVYSLVLDFIPTDELDSHYSCSIDNIRQTVQTTFVSKLMDAITKLLKLKSKTPLATDSNDPQDELILVSKKTSSNKSSKAEEDADMEDSKKASTKEDEDSSSDEERQDEQDNESSTVKRQSTSYSDNEDEEDQEEQEANADMELFADTSNNNTTTTVNNQVIGMSVIKNFPNIKNYQFTVLDNSISAAFDLTYSASTCKFLLLDVIERIADNCVIRQVPSIQKAHLMPPEQEGQNYSISTEGINFAGILESLPFDCIDHTATTCNSIHAILATFGVEAARASIVHEISAVFAVYGINIDPRHLSLIADFMTQEGGYRAFNRSGMENVASPFLKMTFETTVQYLKNATLIGETDELISPASRIVLGLPVALGTGAFEIRQPIS